MERIAIIGLGLIGGSIGLALKKSDLKDVEIAGIARSRDTASRARKLGAIDIEARTIEEAVSGARLVIIASPIMTVRSVLSDIAPVLAGGAVVTDACSTKSQVMRWAKELLPEHAHFVGGHPMAGKETAGISAADPNLFQDKPWVIVPSVTAPESAVNAVIGLAQLVGGRPTFMDADEHDSYVAAVSHLPLAMSSALFSMAFGSAAWPELASLASSGFRDATRLASGSPEMAHDIMVTNKDNVIHWIDRLIEELTRYRATIESGQSEPLLEAFMKPQIERDNFVEAGPPRRPEGDAMPKVSLTDFLVGSRIGDHMRKSDEIIRASEKRAEKKR